MRTQKKWRLKDTQESKKDLRKTSQRITVLDPYPFGHLCVPDQDSNMLQPFHMIHVNALNATDTSVKR